MLDTGINPKQLANWFNYNRNRFSKPKLDESSSWDTRYNELVAYKNEHGDCLVPSKYKTNIPLAQWVGKMRRQAKTGLLLQERSQKLEEIGFVFQVRDFGEVWEMRYRQLLQYKELHGDCLVPTKYEPVPGLGMWVSSQRHHHKINKLCNGRHARLVEAGFNFEPMRLQPIPPGLNQEVWENRYERLKAFKAHYNHCNVPAKYEADQQLAYWVQQQRQKQNVGTLHDVRYQKLCDLGFRFLSVSKGPNAKQKLTIVEIEKWEARFQDLICFKEKYGHFHIPYNSELGKWVSVQKQRFKKNTIPREHHDRLNEIGFHFEAKSDNA